MVGSKPGRRTWGNFPTRLQFLLGSIRTRAEGEPSQTALQQSSESVWIQSRDRLGWARPQHPLVHTRARMDVEQAELGCSTLWFT